MAVDFIQERKKQRYLIIVLIFVIFLGLMVAWRSFLLKTPVSPAGPRLIISGKKIEVDMSILTDSRLEELQPFEPILPLPSEEFGRENPFIL